MVKFTRNASEAVHCCEPFCDTYRKDSSVMWILAKRGKMRGDFGNSSMIRLKEPRLRNLAISVHLIADENGISSHSHYAVVVAPADETL